MIIRNGWDDVEDLQPQDWYKVQGFCASNGENRFYAVPATIDNRNVMVFDTLALVVGAAMLGQRIYAMDGVRVDVSLKSKADITELDDVFVVRAVCPQRLGGCEGGKDC